MLDPDNGRQLWRLALDLDTDTLELYRSVAVFASPAAGTLTGLDVRTGGTLWTVPFAAGDRLVPVRSEAELDGPGRSDAEGGHAYEGDRVVTVDGVGQFRILDVHTGRLRAAGEIVLDGAAVPPAGDGPNYHAVGGTLFVTTGAGRFHVRTYDLDSGLDLGTVYRSEPGRTFGMMTVCGARRLCVLENGPAGAEVIAVDLATRREVWRRATPAATKLLPVGDRLAVIGGAATLYFDSGGRDVLGDANAGTGAARANGAGALLHRPRPDGTALEGVGPDGTRTDLGTVPADIDSCDWNERVILCPTTEEYGVWRFAN